MSGRPFYASQFSEHPDPLVEAERIVAKAKAEQDAKKSPHLAPEVCEHHGLQPMAYFHVLGDGGCDGRFLRCEKRFLILYCSVCDGTFGVEGSEVHADL